MNYRYSPDKVAKGCKERPGEYRKVVITIDEETFAEVRAGAVANRCSFTAQARMLIEVGLETLKQDLAA